MAGVKYIGPVLDGCYDDQTEVLTADGWKYFADLSFGDPLATLNVEGVLEYHKPDQLIVKDWEGEMCRFFNSRTTVDLLVTPDHNMWVAPEGFRRVGERFRPFRFEKAIDILDKYRLFRKDCINPAEGIKEIEICGRKIKTEHWLEFLGYYLSEGSSTITKKPNHYIVQLRQYGPNLVRMSNALQRVTLNKINIRPDGRVVVNDKELASYLKFTFGNTYHKFIPREILNQCSSSQLSILFNALMLGDGHTPTSSSGGSVYYTSSLQLRDDFMELLLKIGLSGSFIKQFSKGRVSKFYDREITAKEDHWAIRVCWKSHTVALDGAGWSKTATKNKLEFYKGKVYCASVPNHTLFVRRNGCTTWCGNSGYAEAARNYVLSIYKQGYPITLAPISFEKTRPNLGEEGKILQGLINKPIDYDKVIVHSTPDLWKNFTRFEDNKYIIGYTVWETSQLHPIWTVSCNQADEVWVPCDWNIEVFKNSGVRTPLYKIPHAIKVPDSEQLPDFNLEGVSDSDFVFYSIFQWQERKNPYGLLTAFCSAFNGVRDVVLVLKTYLHDQATDKEQIRQLIMDFRKYITLDAPPKLYLIVENMSSANLMGLHKRGDAFVLLQRSEGWGLPHFEAASLGKPVITTGYGGQNEFLKADNSYLVDFTLSPVTGMTWSPYYTASQYWAETDLKHAVDTMRHVYDNREEAKDKGLKAKQYITDNFSWDKVGKMIVDRLAYLDNGGKNV